MPDEDVSSDTLRDRFEAFSKCELTDDEVRDLVCDLHEYAAQLEDQVETLQDEQMSVEAIEEALAWRDERDEARAERDRALQRLRNIRAIASENDKLEHAVQEAMLEAQNGIDEVERGDTVDQIRREAFEKAADHLEKRAAQRAENGCGTEPGEELAEEAAGIRALAEADDQEDD